MSSAAVALAIGLAAPALAQNETVSAASPPETTAPANSEDVVGPAQLRNFSLNGTVTRRAETPPSAPQETATTAAPASAPAATGTAPVDSQATASQPARTEVADAARPARTASTASSASSAFDFPPPTPASGEPAALVPGTLSQPAAGPVADTFSDTEGSAFPQWPWLLALLAALGAAIWYFRRQRPGYAFAGAGADSSAFDLRPPPAPPAPRAAPASQPAPRAPVPEPAPRPAAPPAAPQGIVSTRLRPWLEIEFQPEAAIVDAEKGAIQFEVTIFNSGSAPARDVVVEAALFNAGPDQDQMIGQFFGRPAGQGDRVSIPPLQRMSFRSVVAMPREQLRLFEVEGRSLFVPLVGFNALYRWSSGEGQTSASFLVGRDTDGEKMAPFRVDKGPKTYRGLAAREHALRVRK